MDIVGITRVRNEENVIGHTLEHLKNFCSSISAAFLIFDLTSLLDIIEKCHGCKFAPLGAEHATFIQFLIIEKGTFLLEKSLIVCLDVISNKCLFDIVSISDSLLN